MALDDLDARAREEMDRSNSRDQKSGTSNRLALAGLALAILGCVTKVFPLLSIIPFFRQIAVDTVKTVDMISVPIWILGGILCGRGLSQSRRTGQGRGLAITGLVFTAIYPLLLIVIFIIIVVIFGGWGR